MTCILIPPAEELGLEDLIELPFGAKPGDILGEGPCYSKSLKQGLTLFWKHSQLSISSNAVATKLAGGCVCGDAVVEVAGKGESGGDFDGIDALLAHLKGHSRVRSSLKKLSSCHSENDTLGTLKCPFPCVESTTESQWTMLPPEILGNIVRLAGCNGSIARTVSQVCTSWRYSLALDKATLQSLQFKALKLRRMPAERPSLPLVLDQAVKAGNVSASLVSARYFQAVGDLDRARKDFYRAAKMGHPEAQYKIGVGYYTASLGLHQDSEEALIWLSRAARSLLALQQEWEAGKVPVTVPLLMSRLSCRSILSKSSHILGVLHLDGDSTKQDSSLAIKWFQIAQSHGCAEAGRFLQSLFRSGQY